MPLHDKNKKLVLLGAGGHAKVLAALISDLGLELAGVCDPGLYSAGTTEWLGITVLGGDEALDRIDPATHDLVMGVGPLPGGSTRKVLFERFSGRFCFPPLVHRTAWVAPGTILSDGVQVMAGAIIQPGCTIGNNTTINTAASVDHDTLIGAHCHIAPRATICGGVGIADFAFIGAGATLINGINIGQNAIVGAGTACVHDVPPSQTIVGAALRVLNRPSEA